MPLTNYEKIISGKKAPNFIRIKQFYLDFEEHMDITQLWEIHNDAMAKLEAHVIEKNGRKNLLQLKRCIAEKIIESCTLCERNCNANRKEGEKGFCGVIEPRIFSEFLHFGEEPVLVPSHTIFFAGCNFRCIFCQNWDISQNPDNGEYIPVEDTCAIIKSRSSASLNVNWVGGEPTPNLPYILSVLCKLDVQIPQIWNSNMYMNTATMKLLDGVADLYLADFKYGNNVCAKRLSSAPDYVEVVLRNHKIASTQCDLLVRHLVLPGHVECCSIPVIDMLYEHIGTEKVVLNIMDQYRPEYQAYREKGMNRRITTKEYLTVLNYAKEKGFSCII